MQFKEREKFLDDEVAKAVRANVPPTEHSLAKADLSIVVHPHPIKMADTQDKNDNIHTSGCLVQPDSIEEELKFYSAHAKRLELYNRQEALRTFHLKKEIQTSALVDKYIGKNRKLRELRECGSKECITTELDWSKISYTGFLQILNLLIISMCIINGAWIAAVGIFPALIGFNYYLLKRDSKQKDG